MTPKLPTIDGEVSDIIDRRFPALRSGGNARLDIARLIGEAQRSEKFPLSETRYENTIDARYERFLRAINELVEASHAIIGDNAEVIRHLYSIRDDVSKHDDSVAKITNEALAWFSRLGILITDLVYFGRSPKWIGRMSRKPSKASAWYPLALRFAELIEQDLKAVGAPCPSRDSNVSPTVVAVRDFLDLAGVIQNDQPVNDDAVRKALVVKK